MPVALTTVAPKLVKIEQVKALADAGFVVSLDHTDIGYRTAEELRQSWCHHSDSPVQRHEPDRNRDPRLVEAVVVISTCGPGLIAESIHITTAAM